MRLTISSKYQRERGLHHRCRRFRAIIGANLPNLTPDGFVGDIQPPLRQQILHVPVSSA